MELEVRTAYHEAGHVVMYYVTKKRFRKASIIPNNEYLGIVEEAPIDSYAPNFNSTREAIIMMGGQIAESIYTGEDNLYHKGTADYAVSQYGQGETCNAFLNFILHYTRDLVKKWWPEIEVLAKELLEHKEISYLKAVKLIRETHERRLWGERYEEQKAFEKRMAVKSKELAMKSKPQK